MNRADLADLVAFVAVAETLSFRGAANRVGVTPSAISHAMRQLEQRLGMRLLHRTTRSVALTDQGRRLFEQIKPAMADINAALQALEQERLQPSGRLRLHASGGAAASVIAPVWNTFLRTYPEVHLELKVDDGPVDVVAGGFDAAIAIKDQVPADMVAARVTGPMRAAVVGAPDYFARHGKPSTPDELALHDCIEYRWGESRFSWPFRRDGSLVRVAVRGPVSVNSGHLAVRAAADGLGIAYSSDATAQPYVRAGRLVRVLEDWSPSHEGYYLYYPGHRQVPLALRALIDMIRHRRRSRPEDVAHLAAAAD
jgi:DNA-binding transcriptional LysR family regulator